MINQLLRYITPDEQFTWSQKEILAEIPGFHFQGPGWYSQKGTWMLVIGTDTPDVYTLQVFYDRDPRQGYQSIAMAPVRSHDIVVPDIKKPASYAGLIVLVVGMLVALPLSGFLLHRFHGWGWLMLAVYAFVWGRISRSFNKRDKKNEEKKNEQRSS